MIISQNTHFNVWPKAIYVSIKHKQAAVVFIKLQYLRFN